jgi:CSLREA domain-containing protein
VPVNGAGKLLGSRVLAAAAIALACALASPGGAAAELFTVNTTADEVDATAGNFTCFTAAEKCSLRAALEEANASAGEFDVVEFDPEQFDGGSGSVIELASPFPLPTVVDPLGIYGGRCVTDAGVPGPCVQVDGPAGAPALAVEGAEEVEIKGLALTGSAAGIRAKAAPRLRLSGSWIGVGLDGNADGNAVGVELGPGSDDSRVGFEDPETHNLIAGNTGTGLAVVGSSRVRILGNEFGVDASGESAAPNGAAIVVESTAGGADAVANTIGTRAAGGDAVSPACELGCNLISGSESSGIDISGSGDGDPAIETAVVGNHLGFDRAGTGVIANSGAAILVGAAPGTMIGGPRGADANWIAGGSAAVLAGPGAPYLTVQRNLIGRAAVTGSQTPPADGIVVDSQSLPLLSEEALIVGNEIGLAGGTGISQKGPGATIFGNRVSGAAVGIRTYGEGSENSIEGNAVLASAGSGILVENSFNDIVGNEVVGAGGAGVRIQQALPEIPKGNVIGGDSDAAENTIRETATAIAIADADESLNEVARNRGTGNSGSFIDLIATDPGGSGPNHGIAPPAIVAISESGLAGFAEPGAKVRIFRKGSPDPGELASFFGEATADADGEWSFAFPAPLPIDAAVAATQTKEEGTSELEIATVPPSSEGQQAPIAGAAVDRRPPRTRVLKQPRRVRAGRVARFAFSSNEAGSTFQCSLDRAVFKPCRSPKLYRLSKPAKHLFRVRAVDPAGNVDRTPVRRRFEVIG